MGESIDKLKTASSPRPIFSRTSDNTSGRALERGNALVQNRTKATLQPIIDEWNG